MGEGRKHTRSNDYVLTVYKVSNIWRIYKRLKIFRHHQPPCVGGNPNGGMLKDGFA